MQVKDIGIIIAIKKLHEKSGIVTVFTKLHGVYSGFVQNITGKSANIYQIGNFVDFIWQARLDEHVGTAKCELIESSAHLMNSTYKLYALNSMVSMLNLSLKERIEYFNIFNACEEYMRHGLIEQGFIDYILLEHTILTEIGYGLELDKCAVTGKDRDLAYVSPKSGKAVSRIVGEDYKDKLLHLPECFLSGSPPRSADEVRQLSELMLYFFQRYVFGKQEPQSRTMFVKYVAEGVRDNKHQSS